MEKEKLRKNIWWVLLLVIVLGGALIFLMAPHPSSYELIDPSNSDQNPYYDMVTINLAGEAPRKGDDNAPIIIIEFSDFQCQFCEGFYKNTLPLIERDYISTGKLQFVYRNFPIQKHIYAKTAAIAAECANTQGKFWEMHDKIFDNQHLINQENLEKWAKEISLDINDFNDCVVSQKINNIVETDLNVGKNLGVNGTPTFFIGKRNGPPQIVIGNKEYGAFKQIFDYLLE